MTPLFIGAPGIGKTQGIYQFAEKMGVNVVTFILSNTVPSEVSGIRMPDKETKKMEVFDDLRMASLKDGDILFFDEILEAPPMLWSACLTLIQDRIMASGRKLPDVFIVAASNPVTSPAIIPASVRDRFMTFQVKFSCDRWCQWFKDKHGVSPVGLSGKIREDSDQYNVLTPRRVEKLYMWLKKQKDQGSNLTREMHLIQCMFDSVVAEDFRDMLKEDSKTQKLIRRAIEDSNLDIELPENFDNMRLYDILELLQVSPMWEDIQAILGSVEMWESPTIDIQF